jgi:hypothetical protein
VRADRLFIRAVFSILRRFFAKKLSSQSSPFKVRLLCALPGEAGSHEGSVRRRMAAKLDFKLGTARRRPYFPPFFSPNGVLGSLFSMAALYAEK